MVYHVQKDLPRNQAVQCEFLGETCNSLFLCANSGIMHRDRLYPKYNPLIKGHAYLTPIHVAKSNIYYLATSSREEK